MRAKIEFQKIDHLGIVGDIVDSIGIVEIINNLLSSEPGEKVSAGQVVKAMILNGLSMMSYHVRLISYESRVCAKT